MILVDTNFLAYAFESCASWRPVASYPSTPSSTRAIDLARAHALSPWDGGIVTAAQRAGCATLWTEDLQAGRRFGDVTIVDPLG